MVEILFLLLPLAFYAGWRVARRKNSNVGNTKDQLSGKFVKGVNYLLNEEPDKALEVFLNYPEIDEYTAETYQLLGNSFRNRGEVDRALRIHQNLIARACLNNRQKQKAMYSLGQDFFAAGMLDRAESVFNELQNTIQTTDHLSMASVCTSLRIIYEQTQEWEKAIEATDCYRKYNKDKKNLNVIDTDSLIAHYYCELADESLKKGNIHDVERLINEAKRISKKSSRLMVLEADVFFHQNKYKKSLRKYLSIIQQDSRLFSLFFNKLEKSAVETNEVKTLINTLSRLYKKNKDKTVFEKIIYLSNKYDVKSVTLDQLIINGLTTNKLSIDSISKVADYINSEHSKIKPDAGLNIVSIALETYLEGLPSFRCNHCGYKMHDYIWRCPACNDWDTVEHS